ncbi:YwiC-like family protein [Cellulomonas bogoriensis]|uniref:YwiC-like family protein n=1 Tax=Cellulomonas bogoriensis TaxID=301388 RepID=UPI0009FCE780|nr:YwiC-like family protein [Cellulomonas bogoriensis]
MPNQHGAWAMLLAPVLTGVVLAGPVPAHALLVAAWLAAYLAFFAAGLWLRASRRPRYRPPALTYGAVTALLGTALLALHPRLLAWAPVYAPLLVASLRFSARRQDRTVTNDVVTVLAACLMLPVAHQVGGGSVWPWEALAATWPATVVVALYFVGTVPYVKTMIRERGNPRMRDASLAFHVVATAVVAVLAAGWPVGGQVVPGWAVVVVFVALTVRAVVVPRRWPAATPKQVGLGEVVATVAVVGALLAG